MTEPLTADELAQASFDYQEALMAYEEALGSRDSARRAAAEARLHAAQRRLSAAQAAMVASRSTAHVVTFAALLRDPLQQLDPNSEVWRSIVAYQNATQATASAPPDPEVRTRDR